MYNIKAKNLLTLILAIQLAVIGLSILDYFKFCEYYGLILMIKQLLYFVYLTFIPGFIILEILQIRNLEFSEILLFSVGLSLSFLMFIGFFVNFILIIFGVKNPISKIPLEVAVILSVILLYTVWYIKYINARRTDCLIIKFKSLFLAWLLLPFMSIFGAYLATYHNINILLIILLVLISAIPVLIAFGKIKKEGFTIIIWLISISLLFHTSLVSSYIWGVDSNYEMYSSGLVYINESWNPTFHSSHNAMLSLAILIPTYANLLNMPLTHVFKVVCPIIFSLVPVGLYIVFKKQTNEKVAIFSTFLFVSVSIFYTELLTLARQQIAELFLVLILILLTSKIKHRNLFIIVFSSALILSHYGTSYWYIITLTIASIFLVILSKVSSEFGNMFVTNIKLSSTYILFYISLSTAWYIYISDASIFEAVVDLAARILYNIGDIMDPSKAEGMTILTKNFPFLRRVFIILNIINQIFISIGLIITLLKGRNRDYNFTREYIVLSLSCFIWWILALSLPYLTYGGLGATRLYHLTLFFLAPFLYIGIEEFLKLITLVTKLRLRITEQLTVKLISIHLLIFFIFSSGIIYELAGYELSSLALSYSHDWGKSKDIISKIKFYNWYTCDKDVVASVWLGNYKSNNTKIYADKFRGLRLQSYGMIAKDEIVVLTKQRQGNVFNYTYYTFLGELNNKYNLWTYVETRGYILMWWNTTEILSNIWQSNKIYDNGGSQIYYS